MRVNVIEWVNVLAVLKWKGLELVIIIVLWFVIISRLKGLEFESQISGYKFTIVFFDW